MTDLSAYERILARVSIGETITESVLAELGNWPAYYSKTTREERKLITIERRKHPHKSSTKVRNGHAGFFLTIPNERMTKAKARCKEQGISMRKYVNSLIVADLNS